MPILPTHPALTPFIVKCTIISAILPSRQDHSSRQQRQHATDNWTARPNSLISSLVMVTHTRAAKLGREGLIPCIPWTSGGGGGGGGGGKQRLKSINQTTMIDVVPIGKPDKEQDVDTRCRTEAPHIRVHVSSHTTIWLTADTFSTKNSKSNNFCQQFAISLPKQE